MPANLHVGQSNFAQTATTTSETLVAFLSAYQVNNPSGEGVMLRGTAVFTPGTAATSVTVRLRQGQGTTGSVVGQPFVRAAVAGVANTFAVAALDAFNLTSNLAYSLTIQFGAATGDSAIALANISAICATLSE